MNTQTATIMKTAQDLIDHVVSECDPVDMDARFRDSLDYDGPVTVCGLEFDPSRILHALDETAYDTYFNDYVDGEEVTEINGDYYEDRDVEKAREEFLDGMRDELADLESELETVREDEPEVMDVDESNRLTDEIAAMESRIAELERYTF